MQAPIPPSSLPPHNAPQIDSERGLLASWRRLSTAPLLGLLWLYQRLLRPNMPPLCRFYPSCSDYAVIALKRHGLIVGTVLTTWRLMRCQPLCTGGVDLVPERGHIHLTHCRCSDENQTQKQQQP